MTRHRASTPTIKIVPHYADMRVSDHLVRGFKYANRKKYPTVWEVRLETERVDDPTLLIVATVTTREKARSLKKVLEAAFRLAPDSSTAAAEIEDLLQSQSISYRRPLW